MMAGASLAPRPECHGAHFGIHAVPIVIASFAILTLGAFASALRSARHSPA